MDAVCARQRRQAIHEFALNFNPVILPTDQALVEYVEHEVVKTYKVTAQGLRQLGSGTLSSGGKTPGIIAPAAVAIATGNPIGLIVVGATRIYGEASGSNTPEGRAKATADAIAEQLRIRFRDRGSIN